MENPYNNLEQEIKFCARCGRRLRSAEAIARGYGKICYEKASAEQHYKDVFRPLLTNKELGIDLS